jgi:uncharacterized Fe-S center protein
MRSDVYFVKVSSSDTEERSLALKRIFDKISPAWEYKKEEFIPVKLTIGDSACVYNLSPDLVKVIVSEIRRIGAKPFLFDTSVIYKGERQNAVDHLNLAQSKGFGHNRVGAPFIIADGVLGQDGREFTINKKDINKIKVPSFIGMMDSLLVLSHVTGHIVSRYAGAIKNVAMGMSCRPAKQVQHSTLKPSVVEKKCVACGCCIAICPVKAISQMGVARLPAGRQVPRTGRNADSQINVGPVSQTGRKGIPLVENKAFIDPKLCVGCGECICACKFDAIYINWHEDPQIFSRRMAETANFILSKFKNKYFINFAFDITKECDCISTKDELMVSTNLGILASSDILSLDKATMDLVNNVKKSDYFSNKSDIYKSMFEYAREIGMGNLEYNLINL